MQLKKTKNLSNEEASAYIKEIQNAVSDLMRNIANDKIDEIQNAIEYRNDAICSSVFEDYETIKKLQTFTGLQIEV